MSAEKPRLRHYLEAALLHAFFALLQCLPLDAASALGGLLGRFFGPRLKQHRVAERNLQIAFPDMPPGERKVLLAKMWDHLGRVFAEFSFLSSPELLKRVESEGLENLPLPSKPVMFVSAHLGNWELTYPVAYHKGVPISLVYRHLNNPLADRLVARLRGANATSQFTKGRQGWVKMLRAIKNGESIALLADQKMNEGAPIPFFGRDAMTAPALARLALTHGLPIVPARVLRTRGAHFKGILSSPLVIERTGDEEADIRRILTQVNAMLESWIRETPEQWFWVHRRWEKELYR